MALSRDFRRRIRRLSVSFLGVSAAFYFIYHVFQGDRGVMSWLQLQKQVVLAKSTAATAETERRYLENQVRLLHPASLDPDMLDERARLMLNFGHAGELVILDQRQYRREISDPGTSRHPRPEPAAYLSPERKTQ